MSGGLDDSGNKGRYAFKKSRSPAYRQFQVDRCGPRRANLERRIREGLQARPRAVHEALIYAIRAEFRLNPRADRTLHPHSIIGGPTNVRLGSLADIRERIRDVRFTPKSRHG